MSAIVELRLDARQYRLWARKEMRLAFIARKADDHAAWRGHHHIAMWLMDYSNTLRSKANASAQ